MTDVWDFSDLLKKWTVDINLEDEQTDEENQISEQLQRELDEISSQIALLDTQDPDTLSKFNLIVPHQETQTHQLNENIPETFSTSNTPGNVIKSINEKKVPKIITPRAKEPMRTGPKKVSTVKPKKVVPKTPIFRAKPDELKVVNFQPLTEYVLEFALQNISSYTHGFQLRSPSDHAFTVRVVDKVTTSQIRPGLSLRFEVVFKPTEPRDYEGSILIIPGEDEIPTAISIRCYRDPPQLILPDTVDMGATLLHSNKSGNFMITNKGGVGLFTISSDTGVEDGTLYRDGAFILEPFQFCLERGETKEISVLFKPEEDGEHTASFVISAQNFPQKFFFVTKGVAETPQLNFSICDDARLFLPFLPQDVNTTQSVEIYNNTDVPYPYHIQTVEANDREPSELAALYPETDTTRTSSSKQPFMVYPVSGLIGARERIVINVTFAPKLFAFYMTNIIIFADRIPDETGKLYSKKMLTISTEGYTGPPKVSILPPLVLFNNVSPFSKVFQMIDVLNESNLDIKLRWKKNDVILPSPLVFTAKPGEKSPIELQCFLTKRIISTRENRLLKYKHELRTLVSQEEDFDSQDHPFADERPESASKHYHLGISPLNPTRENKERIGSGMVGEDYDEIEEIPNTSTLRHWNSAVYNSDVYASISNAKVLLDLEQGVSDAKDDALQIDLFAEMNFIYHTHILPPKPILSPPLIDFGSILTGEVASQRLTLVNPYDCPFTYHITFPEDEHWSIPCPSGVVMGDSEVSVDINLTFSQQTALSSMISITTTWINPHSDEPIEDMPKGLFYIPIYAIFDCPIISVTDRVVNIGEVYPTLHYNASIALKLLNSFPTDFTIVEPETINKKCLVTPENSNLPKEDDPRDIPQYVRANKNSGYLDVGGEEIVELTASFSELGPQAMAVRANIIGKTYTCAVVANVIPPKITLITQSIDFSSDFVICNRSHSQVEVINECDVGSTVRVVMIDDCKGVFSLDDPEIKILDPMSSVTIPVSCYSEVHGDYHGRVKLVIRDHWQYKEIEIPLHVKALGSFFGFEKHTLGYTRTKDGADDYVSFGRVKVGSSNIRRLSLVNFSAAAIEVQWFLANYVKGRRYTNLNITVNDDGSPNLSIKEAPDANKQSPFRLATSRTTIESHGKAMVVIELDASEPGEFHGCLAARSGEFVHTLGIYANIV